MFGGSLTSDRLTVIVPTLNGERFLAELLDAVAGQRFAGRVETLVIDSGSTDATLDIARARSGVRLHRIPNAEFGHGRTRNLGVSAVGQLGKQARRSVRKKRSDLLPLLASRAVI